MTSRWYALAVHARSERRAAADIAKARVADDVFVPARIERRAWSDRVKRVDVPLFPGYVFVRAALSAQARVALLKCGGVYDVVGRTAALAGAPIPTHEIEALRVVVAADRALDPISRLVPGLPVVVASGPLRGARGVVETGPDGLRRLTVAIALLGRGVRTVLSADDVVESAAEATAA